MKTYMKSVRHTFENKYVALPLYALLGTSAVMLVRHFLFNKDRSTNDNFRAGATQFDNKQLGTLEPESSAIQDEIFTIQEETLTPENDSLANSTIDTIFEQIELPSENMEIPQSTLINTLDEVTADVPEEKGQCKAITKKGTRCRNKADSSGYCFQHRALRQED